MCECVYGAAQRQGCGVFIILIRCWNHDRRFEFELKLKALIWTTDWQDVQGYLVRASVGHSKNLAKYFIRNVGASLVMVRYMRERNLPQELFIVVIYARKFSKTVLIVCPAVGGDEYVLSCTDLISVITLLNAHWTFVVWALGASPLAVLFSVAIDICVSRSDIVYGQYHINCIVVEDCACRECTKV